MAAAAGLALFVLGGLVGTPATATASPSGQHVHYGPNGESDVNVCSDAVPAGEAFCVARVRTDAKAKGESPSRPGPAQPTTLLGDNGGYTPAYLQSAYNAPSATAGSGQTVATVDAYDYPNAESDLAYYRSYWGLPSCTTANGCFKKVNETGGSALPAPDYHWSQETSLDLDMLSAVCPRCNILLVEATTGNFSDLGASVNTAVRLGAVAVSNSYAGAEFSGETSYDQYYNHPGVAIVASSGDSGYGTLYPAASRYVTAVGGTSLVQNTNTGTRNGSETTWLSSGSGCSVYEAKPSWQHDSGCSGRTVADVSAVGDPGTGVWVYDTYQITGWRILGGTSASSPIIAAMYALGGNIGSSDVPAAYAYAHPTALNDVTSGVNGTCSVSYLCTAGPGYDGPTGLGTPSGTTAFSAGGTPPPPPPPPPPPSAPSAPTNLSASAGSGSVSLSWSPPTNTGGSTVTYSVYRGTSAGGESATPVASGMSGTTFVDSGLADGTMYYYRTVAQNSMGSGPDSNEASAMPAPAQAVPGPVTLSAQTSSTRGVSLSWNAPTTGGTPTSYTIYRSRTSGAETALTTVTCSTTTCAYNDNGAKRNVYYYEVAAVNGSGSGPLSNEASARAL